jgi:hypothetical protein
MLTATIEYLRGDTGLSGWSSPVGQTASRCLPTSPAIAPAAR